MIDVRRNQVRGSCMSIYH